jgi:hypothetical protein
MGKLPGRDGHCGDENLKTAILKLVSENEVEVRETNTICLRIGYKSIAKPCSLTEESY